MPSSNSDPPTVHLAEKHLKALDGIWRRSVDSIILEVRSGVVSIGTDVFKITIEDDRVMLGKFVLASSSENQATWLIMDDPKHSDVVWTRLNVASPTPPGIPVLPFSPQSCATEKVSYVDSGHSSLNRLTKITVPRLLDRDFLGGHLDLLDQVCMGLGLITVNHDVDLPFQIVWITKVIDSLGNYTDMVSTVHSSLRINGYSWIGAHQLLRSRYCQSYMMMSSINRRTAELRYTNVESFILSANEILSLGRSCDVLCIRDSVKSILDRLPADLYNDLVRHLRSLGSVDTLSSPLELICPFAEGLNLPIPYHRGDINICDILRVLSRTREEERRRPSVLPPLTSPVKQIREPLQETLRGSVSTWAEQFVSVGVLYGRGCSDESLIPNLHAAGFPDIRTSKGVVFVGLTGSFSDSESSLRSVAVDCGVRPFTVSVPKN